MLFHVKLFNLFKYRQKKKENYNNFLSTTQFTTIIFKIVSIPFESTKLQLMLEFLLTLIEMDKNKKQGKMVTEIHNRNKVFRLIVKANGKTCVDKNSVAS